MKADDKANLSEKKTTVGGITPKARIMTNRFQLGDKNYVIATSAYEKSGLNSRRGSNKVPSKHAGQSSGRSNVGTP